MYHHVTEGTVESHLSVNDCNPNDACQITDKWSSNTKTK